jgi:FtsZ-interacting cell division protein YlmF
LEGSFLIEFKERKLQMFEDFIKKLRKGIGADQDTDIPSFPTYEEVTPMNVERHEEIKKPATPIVANTPDADSNIELKVVRPASFEEVSEIADYLLDGCTVVLNMEMLDNVQTVRMLDFLNGVTYSNDGEIKNVAKSTYIITPHNVDVSEDD